MATIPLTQGKTATVCDCHYDLVKDFKWCYSPTGYAVRRVGGRKASLTYLHRVINADSAGHEVDHIDRNKLNNDCSNLRAVDHRANSINRGKSTRNTSGYKGVSWIARRNSWQSRLASHGKVVFNRYFKSAEEAALAYNEVAKVHHGEFAQLNEVVA